MMGGFSATFAVGRWKQSFLDHQDRDEDPDHGGCTQKEAHSDPLDDGSPKPLTTGPAKG